MSKIPLPSVINEYPSRAYVKSLEGIRYLGIAVRVARNIHTRCMLSEAQNWKCCWCGTDCVPESGKKNSATIEHVQPKSLGGADDWENYAMACARCNHRRGNMSVEEFLAGDFSARSENCKDKSTRKERETEKKFSRIVRKLQKRIEKDRWVCSDGTPLEKEDWLSSINGLGDNHISELRKMMGI